MIAQHARKVCQKTATNGTPIANDLKAGGTRGLISQESSRLFTFLTRCLRRRRDEMNWDQIQGKWKQVKGQAQKQWGKLTNDDLDVIDGQREQLVGKVQERYGVAKEQAEKQVKEFENSCSC
jgi:uncharacterized protein YjbJ (UPF0337 family)